MRGIAGAYAPFGILAHREADDISHGGPLMALGKIAAMQENPILAHLKKAETLPVVPFDNFGGLRRVRPDGHGSGRKSF